ncbi:unnamed protein product [Heterosigma akashiwo]
MVSNSNRLSVSRAVVLVLCLAHFCNAFHSTSFVRPVVRQTNNVSSKRTANVKGLCMISARKQKFWNQVNGAWAEKFSATEISRILKFEKYNKQELPAPEPAGPLHQPCEEYVEGLEARPWGSPRSSKVGPGPGGRERRDPGGVPAVPAGGGRVPRGQRRDGGHGRRLVQRAAAAPGPLEPGELRPLPQDRGPAGGAGDPAGGAGRDVRPPAAGTAQPRTPASPPPHRPPRY